MIFYDEIRGKNKPIDIKDFMKAGEYDQGDMALISYDDLYDLIHGHENKGNPSFLSPKKEV